jgi:crotonobetainyl-CoA:carnitine CoA-transferase CaiB-like acyl-CoA transferase
LGEHSAEILKELGYSDAEISSLIAQGVTLTAKIEAGA